MDYATAKGLTDGELPKIVRICIEEIEARGLDAEGIYRVSGSRAMLFDVLNRFCNDRCLDDMLLSKMYVITLNLHNHSY